LSARSTSTTLGYPCVPIEGRRTWVPWEQVEKILREAPLDPGFARDIDDAVGDTIDDL
jgi:hypothetical protein